MLNYLLQPNFQFVDISGKPLVGGWIEVYLHNTTIPYITKADFSGTNNPFKVVLNSKGMAVMLASDVNVYDIYVYTRDGSFFCSAQKVRVSGEASLRNTAWGHWVNSSDWVFVDSFWRKLGKFYFAEGNIGESTGETEDVYPLLPEGLYHFDLEFAFESGDNTGLNKYDLRINYGDSTLREMSFTFNDTSSEILTQWCSGIFKMDEDGEVNFYSKHMDGSANTQLKVSHFFVHSI